MHIPKVTQKRIIRFLEEKVLTTNNPTAQGKPLRGQLTGLWRYRVGAYRIICKIEQTELVVLYLLRMKFRDKFHS